MRRSKSALGTLLVIALLPSLATAKPLRRHKTHGARAASHEAPEAADDPYDPRATPGAALRALARRNQAAPGVTNELAPGNKATATGGPAGGVPGFEGM